jgi:hypothetical protein
VVARVWVALGFALVGMGLGAGVAPVQAGANVFLGIGMAPVYAPPPPPPVYVYPAYPPPLVELPPPPPPPGYYDTDEADQLGCGEAAGLIRREGFRIVDTIDCEGGRTYVFIASRYGEVYRVRIDSWSGEIVSAVPSAVN